MAVGQSDLERSTDELETLPEDLPQEPSNSDADVGAAEQAFDLFDEGKLTETGLLAVLGSTVIASDSIVQRALTAVGEGRLSEEALVRIMGK